ncbi:MAG: hypothetical protein KBD78_15395, partial [Oligoflexales bacterium]|nr:hypothetical protein [Oligoflexales bacterium]
DWTEWDRHHMNEEAFSKIALDILDSGDYLNKMPLDKVVSWFLDAPADKFPRQAEINSKFGNPPITLYVDDEFYIDINLWTSSTVSIHQHSFSGAFQVLSGRSLQTTYGFVPRKTICDSLVLGNLETIKTAVLKPGDLQVIDGGCKFIHALYHIDVPSATLIIRTKGSMRNMPQYSYAPPNVAYDPFFIQSESFRRKAQLIGFLADCKHPKLLNRINELVEQSSIPDLCSWILDGGFSDYILAHTNGNLDEIVSSVDITLEPLQARSKEVYNALKSSFIRKLRIVDARTRKLEFKDEDSRLLFAAIENSKDYQSLLKIIEQFFNTKNPEKRLFELITSLNEELDHIDPKYNKFGIDTEFKYLLLPILQNRMEWSELNSFIIKNKIKINLEADVIKKIYHEIRDYSMFNIFFSERFVDQIKKVG